jgi:hypothetical protein
MGGKANPGAALAGSYQCNHFIGEAASAMNRNLLLLGLLLLDVAPARGAADETAADRITLRDGSVVLGLVTSATAGHRGAVEFLVRRDWAERNAKGQLAEWDRAALASARRAIEQRRERLASWRRERAQAPGVEPDDRILRWIDREQKRLADPDAAARTPLVAVRLPRGEVRELDRRPVAASRLLRLAWLSGIREPETMSVADLTGALESRGFAVDAKGPGPSAPLDRLLPPTAETEAVWLARRAATEIALDPGLRFLRYQGMVIPDPGPGQQAPALNPAMAFSELKRLLDPDGAQGQSDPLAEKLQAVASRGRIGAVVTGLTIAPDLGGVTVETTFWVRAPGGRWVAYGSRAATVRADDLRPDEGGDLAGDPQVKQAFAIVEAFGFGSIPPEFKQRSLRIGAATQKALGAARSDFTRDLNGLMLPVLEPASEPNEAGRAAQAPPPAPDARGRTVPDPKPAPRRSMLGPQRR